MTVTERVVDPPDDWPSADELRQALAEGAFVLLPEEVREVDGQLTAFFRTDAQEMRLRALEAGLTPVLLAPEGAALAGYTEYAASWILPAIVTAALAIPSTVTADLIAHSLEGKPNGAPPVMVYREAIVDGNQVRLRELKGPADEVERLLRQPTPAADQIPPLMPLPPATGSGDQQP